MGSSSFEVGCRVHFDGEYGTVKYIGPVEGFEGTWLGVEWDNPSRGKHSGSYKNTAYFTTRIPNAGSFIRISKADNGISCPQAVKLKYGISNSSKPTTFISLPQKSGQERHIEMVGMEKIMAKQSNFSRLTNVVLSGLFINRAGNDNELGDLIPNVSEIDLSQNLIASWSDIISIVKQLPKLSTLVVSKNRLELPAHLETYQQCFSSLRMLVMNDMEYCWKEILTCATMWPYLEELYVLDNKILNLEEPIYPIFSKLCLLSLDNNPISDWMEICKLGKLTNLEELHVDNISLESISFPGVSPLEKTNLFPSLTTLFVRNNKLNQWQDISELKKLAKLRKLVAGCNPILESVNSETARQYVIAKLPDLEILNKIKIERSERRGAELDYIKKFHTEWLNSGGSLNLLQSNPSMEFIALHPTYLNLLQKHGVADENEIKFRSALIKDNLITVRIFSPLIPEKPPVTKRLPAEMTVGKLKALAQRIFKVAAQNITLTRIFKEDETQKTIMDNNLRQLSFYSVSDQDKIAVEW